VGVSFIVGVHVLHVVALNKSIQSWLQRSTVELCTVYASFQAPKQARYARALTSVALVPTIQFVTDSGQMERRAFLFRSFPIDCYVSLSTA